MCWGRPAVGRDGKSKLGARRSPPGELPKKFTLFLLTVTLHSSYSPSQMSAQTTNNAISSLTRWWSWIRSGT